MNPDLAHAWMPVSPCGAGCVTAGMPTVGRIRTGLRLAGIVAALLGAVLAAPVLVLFGPVGRDALARLTFRSVLGAVGARLVVRGDATLGAPAGAVEHRGALVVENHVSWLDIVAINAVHPLRSVAKREIGEWPVLGRMAGKVGTIFLDRERLRALPGTVAEVAAAVRSGSFVNICAEGTTWCGLGLGRFRPALFQAAIDGGVPVRPIALRYRLADGRTTTWPAFIGRETLIDSVCRTARLRGLVIEVNVLDEIAPGRAADRFELAALTELAMRTVLEADFAPIHLECV